MDGVWELEAVCCRSFLIQVGKRWMCDVGINKFLITVVWALDPYTVLNFYWDESFLLGVPVVYMSLSYMEVKLLM
jgi:hypothetical protein